MNREEANRIYTSRRWRGLRARMMREGDYRCSKCKRLDGAQGNRLELHHKTTLYEAPKLAFTRSNLILLCEGCHKEAHLAGRETDPARKAWANFFVTLKEEISNGNNRNLAAGSSR